MKSLTLSLLLSGALAAGSAFAQMPAVAPQPSVAPLPPVAPQAEPPSTVAQGVADQAITAKVTEGISSDPALKNMEFTVATADGIVTINGTANARDQIDRAVAIARSVPGVKSVTNILAVKTS